MLLFRRFHGDWVNLFYDGVGFIAVPFLVWLFRRLLIAISLSCIAVCLIFNVISMITIIISLIFIAAS